MPSISQLGHVALVTPNLARSLWFFRDLVGLEEVANDGTSVYLRGYQELEHHSLILREDDYTGVDHIALRTGAPEDVDAYATRLRELGVEVSEVAAGAELGQGEAIRFVWPHSGQPIELFFDIDKPQSPEPNRSHLPTSSSIRRGLGARRIDHVNVATTAEALEPATNWLVDNLGFKIREYFQPTGAPVMSSWMSVTPQPHDVAIMPDFATNLQGRIHHTSFNVESAADLFTAADVFTEHEIKIDAPPGKHGISQGMFLYARDPGSGHRIEFYSGGYLVFAPDWEPVRWDETNFAQGPHEGLFWYGGPGLPMTPENGMFGTMPVFEHDPDSRAHGAVQAASA